MQRLVHSGSSVCNANHTSIIALLFEIAQFDWSIAGSAIKLTENSLMRLVLLESSSSVISIT